MSRWCSFVWMDGKLVKWDDAKVHVTTSALHYGIGVLEGIRAYSTPDNLYIFRLDDHINRLFESATIHHMEIPYAEEELCTAVTETIKANSLNENCYIRPLVYRGILPRLGVRSSFDSEINVNIIVSPRTSLLSSGNFQKGKRAIVSSWRRISPESMPSKAKCIANYASGALALWEAERNGVEYAILLDSRGLVSECTGQNLFILKHGGLVTPPTHASILCGITRDTLIRIVGDLGINVLENDITRSELYTAEEVFVSGTAAEVSPIVEIDGFEITEGAGEITTRIASHYREVVTGEISKYRNWLTAVY